MMKWRLVIALVVACFAALALVSGGMGQEATPTPPPRCTAENYPGHLVPGCPDECYDEYGGIWDVSGCPGFCDNHPEDVSCPRDNACPEPPPCVCVSGSADEPAKPAVPAAVPAAAPPAALPLTGGAPHDD